MGTLIKNMPVYFQDGKTVKEHMDLIVDMSYFKMYSFYEDIYDNVFWSDGSSAGVKIKERVIYKLQYMDPKVFMKISKLIHDGKYYQCFVDIPSDKFPDKNKTIQAEICELTFVNMRKVVIVGMTRTDMSNIRVVCEIIESSGILDKNKLFYSDYVGPYFERDYFIEVIGSTPNNGYLCQILDPRIALTKPHIIGETTNEMSLFNNSRHFPKLNRAKYAQKVSYMIDQLNKRAHFQAKNRHLEIKHPYQDYNYYKDLRDKYRRIETINP